MGLLNCFALNIDQCLCLKQIEISRSDFQLDGVGHLLLSKLRLFQTGFCLLHGSPRRQTVEDWNIKRETEVPNPVHLHKSFVVVELIVGKKGESGTVAGFGDINAITRFASKNKGKQPVAVYMIYNQTPFVIATPKSAKVVKPKQLEGMTLGAPANDGAFKLFPAFANIAGIDASKVNWQHMKPNLRVTMLKRGKVQGVSGYHLTVLFDAMRVGMNPDRDLDFMRFADFGMDLYSNAVMVSQEMLRKHPDKVKGMVGAINKAFWEVVANPEVGLDAVMRREPLLKRASEKERMLATLEHLIISPEMKKVGMGDIDPVRLKRSIEIVTRAFKLERTPEPDEVFQSRFLPPLKDRMGS